MVFFTFEQNISMKVYVSANICTPIDRQMISLQLATLLLKLLRQSSDFYQFMRKTANWRF